MSELRIADESKEPIKFVAVDDDERDRLMTSHTLRKSGELRCVGLHASAEEALKMIPLSRPRIVFMDIRMPRMSGAECTRRLKSMLPELVVIFVTGLLDPATLIEASRAGGDDYLLKPLAIVQCLATIRFALVRRLANPARHQADSGQQVEKLNHRETQVLELIATGLLGKEIAADLGSSLFAVEKLSRRIYTKIGVTNRVAAANWWHARQ